MTSVAKVDEPMLREELRDDGVMILWFDAPGESVNTLKATFVEESIRTFDRIESDPRVAAVVLASAKKDNFIAGADIGTLQACGSRDEGEGLSRVGQQAVNRIAACRVPVVAAIHGACLGGGLEVAMAARGRVASRSPKTKLGLPEVQLGILPGLGGTQRLPGLVGLQAALDLLLSGRQIDAQQARKMGLVDEVVPEAICVQVAAARALQLGRDARSGRSSLRDLLDAADLRELALAENPLGRKVVFDQARKRLLDKTKGNYPAPERILEVVRAGLSRGMSSGLDQEARAFGDLVVSRQARALRHVYYCQQALNKSPGVESDELARPVERVGVVGAGLMGSGVAYVTTHLAGASVRLKDTGEEGVRRGLQSVFKLLGERVKRRKLSLREAERQLARVTRSTDYSGFQQLDVVIEAVFEDLELKRRILADVEAAGGKQTIFASNTSSLPIAEIAAHAKFPERVLGMHYFSPVHKMPLLEIITTDKTAPWVVKTAVQLGKRQGKTVIVVGDGPGFYTTRILGPYLNEAAFALMEGMAVESIDRALVDAGFPVGPLALLDEIGIDVGAKVAQTLERHFGSRLAPPRQLAQLQGAGRLGRKNSQGFYDYGYDGRGKRPVDSGVYADLGLSEQDRRQGSEGDRAEVAERCLLAMVNEAIHCLGDGVLKTTRDGDIGAIFGLGFPPFLGGPFHYVDEKGPRRVLERLRHFEERFGERFKPAARLVQLAESDQLFESTAR